MQNHVQVSAQLLSNQIKICLLTFELLRIFIVCCVTEKGEGEKEEDDGEVSDESGNFSDVSDTEVGNNFCFLLLAILHSKWSNVQR